MVRDGRGYTREYILSSSEYCVKKYAPRRASAFCCGGGGGARVNWRRRNGGCTFEVNEISSRIALQLPDVPISTRRMMNSFASRATTIYYTVCTHGSRSTLTSNK